MEPGLLAQELSRADRDLFQLLDVQDFRTIGDALHNLNTRWNCLCNLVEECMATDMRRKLVKLVKLAKVYCECRCYILHFNFYFPGSSSSTELSFIGSGYSRN